jgi:hypothetical protein
MQRTQSARRPVRSGRELSHRWIIRMGFEAVDGLVEHAARPVDTEDFGVIPRPSVSAIGSSTTLCPSACLARASWETLAGPHLRPRPRKIPQRLLGLRRWPHHWRRCGCRHGLCPMRTRQWPNRFRRSPRQPFALVTMTQGCHENFARCRTGSGERTRSVRSP